MDKTGRGTEEEDRDGSVGKVTGVWLFLQPADSGCHGNRDINLLLLFLCSSI